MKAPQYSSQEFMNQYILKRNFNNYKDRYKNIKKDNLNANLNYTGNSKNLKSSLTSLFNASKSHYFSPNNQQRSLTEKNHVI